MDTSFPYKTHKGSPAHLGVTLKEEGLNFALFSEHATQVALCLFELGAKKPFLEITFDPQIHKTGYVWHILIADLPSYHWEYAYRIDGPNDLEKGLFYNKKLLLSDPYAKGLNTSCEWGKGTYGKEDEPPKGVTIIDAPFNWEDDRFPLLPMEELVIYEMHVRGFTEHHSSKVTHPGTFEGIIEKIPYLKELGINAIELLPVFEFNECENARISPVTHKPLKNFWGYSTVNFFSPMNRYSSSREFGGSINEFKKMVKALHKNNIEVILDVVFNHTAEGNQNGPVLSMKGIDNSIYYMMNTDGTYKDYTGCGNTLNGNQPIVGKMILDALRYWVSEMHVDGFRFDLASALTRDPQGHPLVDPPLIRAISNDPILAHTKLIAEAWDAGGLYQVGSFPHHDEWAEWNGQYRDTVRRFIKGTDNQAGAFAKALTGSEHLYGMTRTPYHSINFITAHDGFTLKDLVSYQEKHNLANGENNQDGTNDNESWNCGAEGDTDNPEILGLRERQMKNFQIALILSLGTPMTCMGDEYGHTKEGNNNSYCQDNDLNYFLWDTLDKEKSFFRFYKAVIHFRKQEPVFKRTTFLKEEDIDWHGKSPYAPDWSETSRFLAYTLKDAHKSPAFYIAFNAEFNNVEITLPSLSEGKKWVRVIDTSLPSPDDFIDSKEKRPPLGNTYQMAAHSVLLAQLIHSQ